MLILLNTNLELKSGLRTKYWFYWTLRYSAVGLGMLILLNTNLELKSALRTKCWFYWTQMETNIDFTEL